jgi:hypothetical protein
MHTNNDDGFEVREVFFQDEAGDGECPYVFVAWRAAAEAAENDAESSRPSRVAAG